MDTTYGTRGGAAVLVTGPAAKTPTAPSAPAVGEIRLSPTFRTLTAPGTGRRAVQLTTGDAYCYPLYYFIPSLTADLRYLVYHRAEDGVVQMHRLDLTTGESIRLTDAAAPHAEWLPWCPNPCRGVLDHRSVLNVPRGELIYFDDAAAFAVDVRSLGRRFLFEVPPGRQVNSQNCVSADGRWLVYIHHDRALYRQLLEAGFGASRHLSRGTALCAYDLDTGEHRTLVRINSPIHHVAALDASFGAGRFVFCRPASESGMLLTDLRGGHYTHLRTQDDTGASVCHFVVTRRGVAYEALADGRGASAGLYHPDTHRHVEFALPADFGYTHAGRDPEGRWFLFEHHARGAHGTPGVHAMHALARYDTQGRHAWLPLTGDWPTHGRGQRAHFHPQLTPDRRWILFTAGDSDTRTNHIFLLDVRDLAETEGVPDLAEPLER